MDVLVAGDFCPQERVADLFEKGDYNAVLGDVKKHAEAADYSIVNFECPVCCGGEKPIIKVGPCLKCNESGVDALKWAGFNCLTLANNHFYDYGDDGVRSTLRVCTRKRIDSVGGGTNIKTAAQTLFKVFGDKTLAIINCCEHEFSIATESRGGSNPLNLIQQYHTITEAKKKADYVLVIVHGGHEHFQLPSPRMQETYRFFTDIGADAVVNHHQHCFSGYEVYNGKPIIYGLGNFCFDEKDSTGGIWNEGFMVIIHFNGIISFDVLPYTQCDKEPRVILLPSGFYDERLNELNQVIQDKEKLNNAVKAYYKKCEKQSGYVFEPVMNRVYTSLKYRGLLPSFVSKRRKLLAADYIGCESHRDKLLYYLND